MKKFNLSHWAVTHQALVLFLILAVTVGGVFSYSKLGRAEDPNFTIKVGVVTTIWAGATALEMQNQVTDRIEKKLQELPYFHKAQTYAKAGFSATQIEFKDYTPAKQVPELFYQLRKKLSDLKSELPAGLIGPNVNDEFGDVDSVLYMMSADGASYAQMKHVAEQMKLALLHVPNVVKVNIYGTQAERIFIEFSHAKLATLGIPPQAIFDSLARQNALIPAGVIDTNAQRVPLRISGALTGEKAVAQTPVESGGKTFRLGDIATITRGFEEPPQFIIHNDGKAALGIGVVMQKGANILNLGEAVDKVTADFIGNLPIGIDIERIADQPKVVQTAVSEFLKSFIEALAIVLFVSFVSLGWRTGIVVALSVPLVLAAVFIIMNIMGLDLHRITLGALIIALGLLVDDAIIAAEMMVVKMEAGWDRLKAAEFAWESTAFPMLTGTLVTAAGFVPVGFAQSGVGEYAGGIFWVVAIALVTSWFVAVIFTPYLGVKLLPNFTKNGAAHQDHNAIYNTGFYQKLRSLITWCVDHRVKVIFATLGIFVLSVIGFGNVQQQFFPLSERPELFFEMRLPEGTAIGTTEKTTIKAESLLKGDSDLVHYTSYIGQGSPRFWLGLNLILPNEAFAQIVILSKNAEARERIKARLEKKIADGALSEARVRVDRFNFGPPVGFPVQFRIVGPDPIKVREYAGEVRDIMRTNKSIVDPHLDWNEQSPSVRLVIDQERARSLGLEPQSIAQTMQTLLSGAPITVVRDGTEQVQVVARAIATERLSLDKIGDLTVTSRNGVAVPLSQVGTLVYEHEEPILWRRNRDMAITARADVVDGVQPPDITTQIEPNLAALREKLPNGYRIETGGSIEESAKGNASLAAVFPIMLITMLVLLMVQLQSFSKLLLVFSTAPLGIIGASLALNLFNRPFGFVALLGLIALAGMIMRNSVILVDQIDHDLDDGATMKNAIIEATVRRSRPVILTALAAIFAMIPLTGSAFWGPMAYTIMGGLFAATFLTLLFLPALYAFWFRRRLRREAKGLRVINNNSMIRENMAAE